MLVIDGDLLVQSALRAKLAVAGPDWARMLAEAQVRRSGRRNSHPEFISGMPGDGVQSQQDESLESTARVHNVLWRYVSRC